MVFCHAQRYRDWETSGQERSLLQAVINATRTTQEQYIDKISSVFCFNYAGSTGGPPNVPMTVQPASMNLNPVAYVPTAPDMNRSPFVSTTGLGDAFKTNLFQGERVAGGATSNPFPGFKAYGSGGGGFNMIFDGTSNILPVWYGSSIGGPSVRSIDLCWGFNHQAYTGGINWANISWGIRVIRPNGANVPVIICNQFAFQNTMTLPNGTGDIFGDGTLIIQVLNKVADSTATPINTFIGQPNEFNIIRLTASILGASTPQPIGYQPIPVGVTTFPAAYSIGHTPTLFCNLNLI